MEKYVEFLKDGYTLRGMLHLPDGTDEKPPVVVILHGFGGDRNAMNFSLTKLSRMLAKNNIASVRFDFFGCGESDGEFVDVTISNHIEDGCAIVDFVAGLNEVDSSRIGLFGISLGGAVASAVAARKKDILKTLCLCCPATNSLDDARNLRVKGIDISDIFVKGYADIGGMKLGRGFYEDAVNLDFYKLAEGFDKKVLLIHGDKDEICPVENSKKYLNLYGDKAELVMIEEGNHSFTSLPANEKRLQTAVDYLAAELLEPVMV
ncbi:alpha/beta hydrolase [Clostridium merdae]|uniref:alpha/beta hydrolase n=1 Tax=Clostridium merdae TaxID=1958780 RepID=UPI000A26B42D|nr:alpha/beta hydrolase [Clostridium merdae]